MNRILLVLKALRWLGIKSLAQYGLYQIGLRTGHYMRVTSRPSPVTSGRLKAVLPLPSRDELLTVLEKEGKAALLVDADEIVAGKVRLFGAEPVELTLALPGKLAHWTAYETGKVPLPAPIAELASLPTCDVKRIWEPARFGWAFSLGRAYHISGNEKYAKAFWHYAETFLDANPPYLGPNWMSGQEVALRLMAFVWAAQILAESPASTPERMARLAQSIAHHALGITLTLVYARSQNNNHLLTEAAGLLTAGLALRDHPESARWQRLGRKGLDHGFRSQIDSCGEYAQHSTNYHRLMLQVALWTNALIRSNDLSRYYRWPRQTSEAIERSVHWLLSLLDPESGRTPNLGANDGAYIFPLAVCPYNDYRPVIQAAAQAFLDYQLPRGVWDEMSLWFGIPLESKKYLRTERYLGDHLYAKRSWAYLRTAQFTSRPSHADQLHLDLWWRGLNVAQDAGTYLYNAAAPWDNSLTTALVHNTVTVNGRDQMTRAGRFLYLDWVNAYRQDSIAADECILQRASARHYGYRRLGVRHERVVTVYADERWQVEDELLILRRLQKPRTFRLHWLLPDWEWKVENRDSRVEISLESPLGVMMLALQTDPPLSTLRSLISLARCGELIYGEGLVSPIMGWVSPTYGVKIPALSFTAEAISVETVKFTSEFAFPLTTEN